MEMFVEFRELRALKRKTRRFNREFNREFNHMRDRYMTRLLEQTIINASGPPGPNVVTGQYISRFVAASFLTPDGISFGVFNDSPQTLRLELGFVGTDSAGRNYNQAARPHMGPALVTVGEEFQEELAAMPEKVWNSL